MLTPAPESLFWYWIEERHSIYNKRAAGHPKPWTTDPILRDYKFTNVFRQLDRGTAWLTEHFIAPHQYDEDLSLLVGNVCWYRMFNWIGTGELLGWRQRWQPSKVRHVLKKAQNEGKQIFTGAHIIWGEFGMSKIDGVVDCCTRLWERKSYVAKMARFTRSLEKTFNLLAETRGVGGFMGYEIVSDLRHTPLLDTAYDINMWANVGPGAMRGLRRLFPAIRQSEALQTMRDLHAVSRLRTSGHVPALELRDIEHSLCEFDKYCRVKFGEGRPRSKYPGAAV